MAIFVGILFRSSMELDHPNQMTIQNLNGLIYIYICESSFPAIYGMLGIFPDELPIARREISTGMYSASALYAGKQVALLPGNLRSQVRASIILATQSH